jgi:hypothetical protein
MKWPIFGIIFLMVTTASMVIASLPSRISARGAPEIMAKTVGPLAMPYGWTNLPRSNGRISNARSMVTGGCRATGHISRGYRRDKIEIQPRPVQSILLVRESKRSDAPYLAKQVYAVPSDHAIGDGLFAYEGVGWESERIAYRLYLDERNVVDIFGKKRSAPVLHRIGQGQDDYHKPAAWGMDILKVGQSMGIGGLGVMRAGKATQLGPAKISAETIDDGGRCAAVAITSDAIAGTNARLVTHYSITAGSNVTQVNASLTGGELPLVAGIVKHAGVHILAYQPDQPGWSYIATWGRQSLAEDGLGLALFYRSDSVKSGVIDDDQSLFVVFSDPKQIEYRFAAVWEQGQNGVTNAAQFQRYLRHQAAVMNRQTGASGRVQNRRLW